MSDMQSATPGNEDHPMPTMEVGGLPELSNVVGNLEFDREEKARLVALILAIQYHVRTIISDAEYLRVMLKNEQHLEATRAEKVVAQAECFYKFLKGGSNDK